MAREKQARVPHAPGTWIDPATGRRKDFLRLMQSMARRSVVLLGETHDRPEVHRWQLHTAAFIYARRPEMMMGFEMFPRSAQPALDAWVEGELGEDEFLERVRWDKVWGFPAGLYLPLFYFCRENRVRMLGLNCRRDLVTRVGKEGWGAVPESERDAITPAAPPEPGYAEHLSRMMPGGGPMRMDSARFMRAMQAWDRAFACNIASALREAEPGKPPVVIGIIGRGHLEYGFGTPRQLADLGIPDSAVLLPSSDRLWELKRGGRKFADAVFRIPD